MKKLTAAVAVAAAFALAGCGGGGGTTTTAGPPADPDTTFTHQVLAAGIIQRDNPAAVTAAIGEGHAICAFFDAGANHQAVYSSIMDEQTVGWSEGDVERLVSITEHNYCPQYLTRP